MLAGTAAEAAPGGLRNGIYDAYDCDAEVSDQRIVLTETGASFYESNCTLSNPQSIRGMPGLILLDASCEGEGTAWNTRFLMMQTRDGGLSMMQENWGDHYERCD